MNYAVSSAENDYVASSVVNCEGCDTAEFVGSSGGSGESSLLEPWAD